MRVAVVSPETIHHRDADDTRRLQRLVRGLDDRGHEVTVCCGRWWDGEDAETGDGPVADADPDETSPADTDDLPTGDPDQLPPAGTPAAGEDADRAPDESGVAASQGDAFATEDDARSNDDVESTVTVDGITYRAVVADATDHRSFATWTPLAIRKCNPDVIHAVATPPSTVVAARVGATIARAPVLAEWYDPSLSEGGSWTTSQALKRPGRIVTPSRLTRRQLLELGADDAKLQVIPNAIDLDQIESVDPADEGDVVYARRLDEDANLESLFLGLAELRDRGWSATIVGDGPARHEYEQQAKDLRIDDRVTFVGACDREERVSIYRGAHAFVQTARRCVFATELCWALACGCVGIVEYHADSSAHELVEGRDRGFRTTNPRETAQAIRDAGGLERLAIDESFASFDESTVLEQYESCYQDLREQWGIF
ncbi:glycosyltransferase [Salinarchaeum sp. Harcht-Bsk1]|uniref:glycosyltransferase n=1 Tax=Salinarchaeum sp. Harcht-Bsk1 TaxID=1333523 RepID=UPI0003422EAA|nr:glycosyltransferase [Salinarchaeum sp. Harcht-Bsk1]AGN00269.1 glycosyltransferase [Salinarchaeum sp. Harcht-Bsk1]